MTAPVPVKLLVVFAAAFAVSMATYPSLQVAEAYYCTGMDIRGYCYYGYVAPNSYKYGCPIVITGYKPDGTSCGSFGCYGCNGYRCSSCGWNYYGICQGGSCVTPSVTTSVSHSPASPSSSDNVTFTATAGANLGSISSVGIVVDGSSIGTCASSPCAKTGGPYGAGTHTYYSSASSQYTSKSSATGSFNIVNVCNVNNVCESNETLSCQDCLDSSEFSMGIDPAAGVANKGDVKTVNVSVNVTGTGYAQLQATGLPAGTTASFSPASCGSTCYSNASINTTASTPDGSSIVTIKAVSGGVEKAAAYNLTVLASGIPATCGAPTTCDSGETQSNCASDCFTTTSMPSPVSPGQIVAIIVEFNDFRYLANGKVSLDLRFDSVSGTAWNSANGCSIGGVKLGPTNSGGTVAWPSGTTSENGHFEITTLCTIPSSISNGAHTLFATPTIY